MSRPSSPVDFSFDFEDAAATVMPFPVAEPIGSCRLPFTDDGIRTVPLPGVRCPTCAAKGEEVWVIPGRACGNCGTPCC